MTLTKSEEIIEKLTIELERIEKIIEKLTRELERIEIWLSQHLTNNVETKPSVIEIPTLEVVEIYRLVSDTLEKI